MEFVGSSKRGMVGGLIWTIWVLTVCLNVPIAYMVDTTATEGGYHSWRVATLGMSLPMWLFLVPILARLLPESPRWLLSHARSDEAWAIVVSMCEMNGVPLPEGGLASGEDSKAPPLSPRGGTEVKTDNVQLNMCHLFSSTPVNGL